MVAGCSAPRTQPRPEGPIAPITIPTPTSTQPPETPLRFAAVGDLGDGSANQAAVGAAIAQAHASERIDLLLLLGDLIYPNGNPAEYERKFAQPFHSVIEAGIETHAVLGNHDAETDPDAVASAFGMPARYYTFTLGPVQFFALDSSSGAISELQRAWLQTELENSTQIWKIVFLHHPLYSSGIHGSTFPIRSSLEEMLVRHGVQLVLAGHDHNYERTAPIKGIVHVVSGTGCCPRPGPLFSNAFTASFRTGLGLLVGEVTSRQIAIQWLDVEGRIQDSAVISLPVPLQKAV